MDPSKEGTKDYAFAAAILAFLFFFASLLALFFAAFFFPILAYAQTVFFCNNPLHVRVRGVRVWSRIRMLFQQIIRRVRGGPRGSTEG